MESTASAAAASAASPGFFHGARSRTAIVFYVALFVTNAALLAAAAADSSWGAWALLYGGALIVDVAFTASFALAAWLVRRSGREAPLARLMFSVMVLVVVLDELALASLDLHGC